MDNEKTLISYFDKVYCINLAKRVDRWEKVNEEFRKHNLTDIVRYEAIDGCGYDWSNTMHNKKLKVGELGLVETHIQIITEAVANNYESILILEDDVQFSSEIAEIEKYMLSIPNNWDMIYFGGNHQKCSQPQRVAPSIYKLNNTFTTHCIAIKKNIFEHVLKMTRHRYKPIDVYYTDIQKMYNVYGIAPSLATQAVGYSDIQNKVIDYRYLIV